MNWGTLSLLFLLGFLVLGFLLHRLYIDNIYKKISSLSKGAISEDTFYEDMFLPQGSNFNIAAIGSWILLFVAIAYFYFLTPTIFSFNYFGVPVLASSPLGFFFFGLMAALITSIISVNLPKFYSFYDISWMNKKAIIAAIPLLALSLFCSAYSGTVYPANPGTMTEIIALGTLLASEIMLLSPILINIAKVAR